MLYGTRAARLARRLAVMECGAVASICSWTVRLGWVELRWRERVRKELPSVLRLRCLALARSCVSRWPGVYYGVNDVCGFGKPVLE